MIGKAVSLTFSLYTLPARMAYRSAANHLDLPPTFEELMAQLRANSEQVARDVQSVFASVDQEMSARAAHLSPEQRQQAAELALSSAEKHLGMAAVNVLRALWLSASAQQLAQQDRDPSIVDQQ